MIENGLPATLNLTLVPNLSKVVEIQVSALDGSFRDMSGYTYEAEAIGVDGSSVFLPAWVEGDSPDVVNLQVPGLKEGRYRWYLSAVTEDGEVLPLLTGVFGAHYPAAKELVESPESPNRRLVVRLGAEGTASVARWVMSNRIDVAVESAENAAQEAIGAKNAVLEQLQAAQAFIDSFNRAISEAVRVDEQNILIIGDYNTGICVKGEDGLTPYIGINGNWWAGNEDLGVSALGEQGLTPYIGADGCWCIGTHNTGVLARGVDGIDGDTVRRILVDTYEDIPQEGETCNGGFYYYVALGGTRTVATGWVRLSNGGIFSVGGVEIRASSAANAVELLAEVEEQTGVYAELDSVIPTLVRLTALEAGVAGNRIKLETNDSRVILSGAHLTGGTILTPTEWEMYAWLEGQGDLAGEWVKVGEVDDIATTRTYGMVKLSTDNKLSEGGIVGTNESGRMLVSVSSAAVYGTGKLSGGTGISGGGAVGMTANGAYMVEPAGYGKQGTVSYSVSGTVDVPAIGRLANGAAGIRWATTADGGAVLVASDMNDARTAAMVNASTVRVYLQENYVSNSKFTTGLGDSEARIKDWADARFVSAEFSYSKRDIDQMIAELEETTYSKEEADEEFLTKRDAEDTYVAQSDLYPPIVRISREAFDALETRDPNVVYLVKRKQ